MAEDDTDDQQEPTMEEILASIRRIISEDDGKDNDAGGDAALAENDDSDLEEVPEPDNMAIMEPEIADEADTLELTEILDDPDDGSGAKELSADDVDFIDGDSEPEPAPMPEPLPEPAPQPQPMSDPAPGLVNPPPGLADLMSDRPAANTATSFAAYAGALAASRGFPVGNFNRTLEDIVKELLRPMLSDWLDEHLPTIVDNLVEREIKKLAGQTDKPEKK